MMPPVTPKPVPSLPDLLEEIEQRAIEHRMSYNAEMFATGNSCSICVAVNNDAAKLVKALRRAVEMLEEEFGLRSDTSLHVIRRELAQLLSDQRDVEGETKLEEEKADLEGKEA